MKKRLKVIGIILFLLLIALALSGFIYEKVSYKKAKDHYPPEGQMMNVGDRDIHVNLKGKKTDLPPVVIETGTGTWSYDWLRFQKKLSKHTLVMTYDRAGYGYSDPPSNGFSLDSTVSDLNTTLEKTEIDTPVILIGHSVGGVYARHFADQHPEKIAGLILVDSRNEFFKEAAPDTYIKKFFKSQSQTFNKILSRFGMVRLFGKGTLARMPDSINKEKYVQVQYDTPFFNVLDEEIIQIPKNVESLNNVKSLRDKPLTIITPEKVDSQAIELGFSKKQADKINQKWKDSQEKLKGLSTNSELIYVQNSSHAVMYDKPKVIMDAVLDMGDKLRR